MKLDAQTTSSSRPSVGAMVAPITETPVVEVPVVEAPITEAPVDETPGAEAPVAPPPHLLPWRQAERVMANRGQSKWRLAKMRCSSRLVKHARSQWRKHKPKPLLPFPVWDSEGRLASILQLYTHAAEQPVTHQNVAGSAIMHLHLEMLHQNARCLGNQVTCMIAEYHLTGSAQGPSSLSSIIPQEAAVLLPALKNYVPGIAFEGTRDVRVVDHTKTLWVAVWLHWLDMAMGGGGLASETLEVLRHHLGPLLELFLTPRTSNLTFQEVVDCVLNENHRASQQSLHHLRGCCIHDREVLDGLIKAHR